MSLRSGSLPCATGFASALQQVEEKTLAEPVAHAGAQRLSSVRTKTPGTAGPTYEALSIDVDAHGVDVLAVATDAQVFEDRLDAWRDEAAEGVLAEPRDLHLLGEVEHLGSQPECMPRGGAARDQDA